MTTLAKRVYKAMVERGCSVTELAGACGIRPPSVSDWLNGKTKTLKSATAMRAAKFLHVNQLWLTEGTGPMKPAHGDIHGTAIPPGEEFVSVARVLFKLSAGCTGYQVEHIEGNGPPIFFRRDWIERHNYNPVKLLAVRINGSSMEPGLYDGDLVVINTADVRPQDGDVFAANYEGELVIKRLKRDSGEWWLSSDNQDKRRFPDKRCDEHASLIGKVIYKQSERI